MKRHGNVTPVQRGDRIRQRRLYENKSFKFDSWLDSAARWLRKHSSSLSAWAVNDVYLWISIYAPNTQAATARDTTMNLNQKKPRQEFSIITEMGGRIKTCVRERSFRCGDLAARRFIFPKKREIVSLAWKCSVFDMIVKAGAGCFWQLALDFVLTERHTSRAKAENDGLQEDTATRSFAKTLLRCQVFTSNTPLLWAC